MAVVTVRQPVGRGAGGRDAIVIGAGPAGSATAIGLARRGWRVLLVDRGPRGRPKCCGNCLHPRGAELVRSLGCGHALVGAPRTAGGDAWHVTDGGARRVARETFARGGVVVDRGILDRALATSAERHGVDVRHGVGARLVGHDHTGALVAVGTRVERCALAVGADGLGSAVARQAGRARLDVGRSYGFSLDVPADARRVAEVRGRIGMLVSECGYLGVVLGREGADMSLHCAACVRPHCTGRTAPMEVFDRFVARSPELRSWLPTDWRSRAGGVLAAGPMPWRTTARTAGAVALVGDAAGYVEPFTGEGITWALESAAALVESVHEPGAWGERERERYERLWRERVRRGLGRAAIVAALVARPRVLGAVGALGRMAPFAGSRLTALLVPR